MSNWQPAARRARHLARVLARGAAVAAVVLATGPAAADVPGPVALPIAVDLSRVAVGSWAEYELSGAGQSSTLRWSVVGRGADGTTLEVSIPQGELGGGKRGAIVQRITVAPDAKAPAIKGTAIQVAEADPLELPARALPARRFAAVDPAKQLERQALTVRAGTFNAARHRQVTAQGTIDFWVADAAGPLGIVKLTLSVPPAMKVVRKRAAGPITMELIRTGGDATAAMRKPPVALDPATLAAARSRLGIAPPALRPQLRVAPTTAPVAAPSKENPQ